jgi:acetyltransferase-like isoleucine patch superfamily enzyme
MLRKYLSKKVSKIKGESYQIDNHISFRDLLSIVHERIFMKIRGFLSKPYFKKSQGSLFIGKRVTIKHKKSISLGSNVTIKDNCYINALSIEGVFIGNNFSLGRSSIIECTGVLSELGSSLHIGNNVGISSRLFMSVRGQISVGDNTIFGPNVSLISENHNYKNPDVLIRFQGTNRRGISIGNDCWIGANAVILDGVSIGDGAVVASGAIVTKDVLPLTVVAGVPAKIISVRKSEI